MYKDINVLLDVRKDRSLDIYAKNVVCIHRQLDIKEYSMLDIKIDVQK